MVSLGGWSSFVWVAVGTQPGLFSTRVTAGLLETHLVCDAIVVHVRVGSGAELGFGRAGSARGDGQGCAGERRGPGQGQRLPVVFEAAQLPIEVLQFPVLLRLQGHHLFDVFLSEFMQLLPQVLILHLALIIAAPY